jgi:hypothetical protein
MGVLLLNILGIIILLSSNIIIQSSSYLVYYLYNIYI